MSAIQIRRSSDGDSTRSTRKEETMVGFEDEVLILKEQLTGGSKQLQIVSIIGMPGQGKTTLATHVYNDPLISHHFHIRKWICVSQDYQKRDLLLGLSNGNSETSDQGLAEKLYKSLKGRRYLIVMDDIWSVRAWDDLKSCFPNDKNGSRVMFTSRLENVALHAKPTGHEPLYLRSLTQGEAWEMFGRKVFQNETYSPELVKIGERIVDKCRGLPLAIALVAGVLASDAKSADKWKQIENDTSLWRSGDPELWMKPIELSYDHLSHHWKQCFLCVGGFPEDFRIPAWELKLLWVAEGFIENIEEKSLEDVAEEYLLDLIGKSLVSVSYRDFGGEILECRIHDLLREFCLKKAEGECFLRVIRREDQSNMSSGASTFQKFLSTPRLFVYSSCEDLPNNTSVSPDTCSIMFNSTCALSNPEVTDSFAKRFKHLSVLVLRMRFSRFPCEILQLLFLRYLSLHFMGPLVQLDFHVPSSISNLCNLETLIVDARRTVILPHSVTEMAKLRHIFNSKSVGPMEVENSVCQDPYPCFLLENLQTLSSIEARSGLNFLVGTPNLKKLSIQGKLVEDRRLEYRPLDLLNHLQELRLFNTGLIFTRMFMRMRKREMVIPNNLGRFLLPSNLNKLTLHGTQLDWGEISTLGKMVPNLEVLDLSRLACVGECWETMEGDFPRLKFLRVVDCDFVWWYVSSSNHFPRLECLVLSRCDWLKEIPSEIGDIPTLKKIQVLGCGPSVDVSATKMKEAQENLGNNLLQIIVRPKILTEKHDKGKGISGGPSL